MKKVAVSLSVTQPKQAVVIAKKKKKRMMWWTRETYDLNTKIFGDDPDDDVQFELNPKDGSSSLFELSLIIDRSFADDELKELIDKAKKVFAPRDFERNTQPVKWLPQPKKTGQHEYLIAVVGDPAKGAKDLKELEDKVKEFAKASEDYSKYLERVLKSVKEGGDGAYSAEGMVEEIDLVIESLKGGMI